MSTQGVVNARLCADEQLVYDVDAGSSLDVSRSKES